MKKLIAQMLVAVMTVSLLAGCASKKEEPAPEPAPAETQETKTDVAEEAQKEAEDAVEELVLEGFDEGWEPSDVGKKVIGVVPWSMAHEFNSICAETCKDLCEQLGWEATIYDPDADWTQMMQIIEDLIIQDVDGIIFTAIDTEAASPLVDKVHEAGIVIVDYDCCASEGNADMDVVYDDYQGGVMAAEQAMKALDGKEDAQIVVFEAEPSIATSGIRINGFTDYLKENYPKVEVIQNRTTDRTNDGCYQWALDMYTAYPDVDLFFLYWGDCATSVWYALQSAGAEDVYVIGYDATDSHLDIMLEEGPECKFFASVGMFPEVYARVCVEKMNEIFAGKYERKGPDDKVVMMPEVLTASDAKNWTH